MVYPLVPDSLVSHTCIDNIIFDVDDPLCTHPRNIQLTIFLFKILIGSGVEKRGLITKIWNSEGLQKQIGQGWVFDGNRLAWYGYPFQLGMPCTYHVFRSMKEIPNRQFTIDLDEEQGVVVRPGRLNSHKVQIRPSTKINLAAIQAYLNGKMTMDNSVLQAIGKPNATVLFFSEAFSNVCRFL